MRIAATDPSGPRRSGSCEPRVAAQVEHTRRRRGTSRTAAAPGPESLNSAPATPAAIRPGERRPPRRIAVAPAPARRARRRTPSGDREQRDQRRGRHEPADRLPPGELVAAGDDVPQRAGAVGAQHRAREVRVAAGRQVDGREQREPGDRRERSRPPRARRVSPPGQHQHAPRPPPPAPIVMTPPTSAPSRPAPTISAERQPAARERGRPRRASGRGRTAAPPSADEQQRRERRLELVADPVEARAEQRVGAEQRADDQRRAERQVDARRRRGRRAPGTAGPRGQRDEPVGERRRATSASAVDEQQLGQARRAAAPR